MRSGRYRRRAAAVAGLAGDIARGLFTGRVAIWGAVVPLGCLVFAWCAMLIWGNEDMALAFGARWGNLFAWWLGGIIAALVGRRIASHLLQSRRHDARRGALHRMLAEDRPHRPAEIPLEPRPALTLLEVIVAIVTAIMVLSIAAPAAGMPGEADFFLYGPPSAVVAMAAILTSTVLLRGAERSQVCRKRFDKWKALRESRREARSAAGTEDAQ